MRKTNEEKELMKFISDPYYREKVISKIHEVKDEQYNRSVENVKKDIDELVQKRTNEINRIANLRWENVIEGKFAINRTEGKVKINQNDVLFSSIKGAEINSRQGVRTVTDTDLQSKKNASLGGALVGGALLGGAGAMAGGIGLGKTKTKGQWVSNQIPTCMHLGVLVDVEGFVTEISILDTQVDQSSDEFTNAYNLAQNIVAQLCALSRLPVPTDYIKAEDEVSVKDVENLIVEKQVELQNVIADVPTYEIPNMYRSEPLKHMSDKEYLEYLELNDRNRPKRMFQNKSFAMHGKIKSENANNVFKKIGTVVVDVIFWILSIFLLIFSIVGFTTVGGTTSGIVFLITALFVNPLIYKAIKNKFDKIKRWICVIIFIVGFIFGIAVSPSDTESEVDTQTVQTINIADVMVNTNQL